MSNNSELIGKTLGTCVLEQLIGRGGMGAVYLAQQQRPIRRVAVKVLLPGAVLDREAYSEFFARFRREANIIAQLEHINIMPIYEYGEQDGLAYLVMPHLTGGSLRDILARKGALSLEETLRYIEQAASALDYAHAHGVVHRDLKPSNFLLHADGRLVLADFGIARMIQGGDEAAGEALTSTGMFLGTPEYMAPEMAQGEHVDYRADIYELGIVLFQMLSGTLPFRGNTPFAIASQHIQQSLPSLHSMNPAIPATVDAAVQQATAKRPEDRFQSAGALAQAFSRAMTSAIPSSETIERNALTVLSPLQSIAPQVLDRTELSNRPQTSNEPHSGGFTQPVHPIAPITSPSTLRSTSTSMQPWLIFIGLLLVLLLVVGGVLIGLQLNKGGTNPATRTATTPNVSQHISTPVSNSTLGPTVTTAPSPTSVPTATPTPTTAIVQTGGIPKGTAIYAASLPGHPCDQGGGKWVNYNQPVIVCQSTNVEISNPNSSPPNLVGTFLLSLPNSGDAFPSNYVIEARFQINAPQSDFGIYFRNQPGNLEGTYTFLIHPDNTWSMYSYDNYTSARTEIAHGNIGTTSMSMTVDVVANGANFSFYINGKPVGSAQDTLYSSGTVGIALDASTTIFVSNFALYTIQ